MYAGTEELLKFQFMSMSMSYFSSLNMLKSLRDINVDTTSKAISSSSSTAAAAAANVPSLKKMSMGAGEIVDAMKMKEKMEDDERAARVAEANSAAEDPFPEDVTLWSITDVGRWLESLSLPQYRRAWEEAAVDGEFLMELEPEDMRDVLGMVHELHVKKVVVARDKLKPLSAQERAMRDQVLLEDSASRARGEAVPGDASADVPEASVVFSQCRNGRKGRVEDAIGAGFDVDTEDEHGNTLLIVSSQQVNLPMIEMLLSRGAAVNHQNSVGNTALHYAMAYDPSGDLGEFLIGQGAEDFIENKWGLSPYDGITEEDAG